MGMANLKSTSQGITNFTSHTKPLVLIQTALDSLTSRERRVAEYILAQPHAIMNLSIGQLARLSATSESTVVRFCKKLGFEGYPHLKLVLAKNHTELTSNVYPTVHRSDSVANLVEKTFQYAMQALQDTVCVLSPVALEKGAEALLRANKVVLAGVGGSGAAAEMAVQKLLRLGIHGHVCSDMSIMPLIAGTLHPDDVALGISHRGRTEGVEEFLDIAQHRGATTMAIVSDVQSPVAHKADIVLQSVCPESPLGPEAGSARVAQITVIDALCLVAAVKIGDHEERRG